MADVRTFRAASMADALAKVKKTFGADAVILGTRSLGSGLDRLVGRPTVEITLTGTERRQLESWARRHSSAQAVALRCRITLASAPRNPTTPRDSYSIAA